MRSQGIVLTGDVHQWIESADRAHATETECALALTYARIAGQHGLKVSLFFTGLAVVEEPATVEAILDEGNVEVAGHGWDSFVPQWRYRALNRLFGSPHGSSAMQARMVRRTCGALERVTGHPVSSWRNHAYRCDRHTLDVLSEARIRAWSDEVHPERLGPYEGRGGTTILPINTTPDHEHMYHGDQTPDTVPADKRGHYYDPRAWHERVAREADTIVAAGGIATILAHPLCMKVADDWQTFERLCARLSRHPSLWAAEAAELVPRTSGV